MLPIPVLSPRRALIAAGLFSAVIGGYDAPLQAQPAPAATQNSDPAPSALSQTAEIELLRQQLTELKDRLDKLESARAADQAATKTAIQAAAPTVSTASKLPPTVNGLLQVQSLNFLDENFKTGGLPSCDTFHLRRGELRLTALAITDKISATLMIDPAKTTALRGSSSTNIIRERDNILQEIQISYFLDAGQSKIPVGYESTLTSSSAVPLVERSLIFSQRDPFDGGYGDVRDSGLQLRGSTLTFDYRIGIFNGLGDRQNALSLSDHKAVPGLIACKGIRNLLLGVSGGQGNTGVNSFVTTNGVTTTIVSRDNRTLFNLFGVYKKNKLILQAEYLNGKAAPIVVNANTLAGRDISDYYGNIGYLFTPKIEGIFRYDTLDTNRDVNDSAVRDLILGLNITSKVTTPKSRPTLVQRSGGANVPTNQNPSSNLSNDRLELRTALQVAF